jgi:hypothetical protein
VDSGDFSSLCRKPGRRCSTLVNAYFVGRIPPIGVRGNDGPSLPPRLGPFSLSRSALPRERFSQLTISDIGGESGGAVTRFESPFLVYCVRFKLPDENIRRSKISLGNVSRRAARRCRCPKIQTVFLARRLNSSTRLAVSEAHGPVWLEQETLGRDARTKAITPATYSSPSLAEIDRRPATASTVYESLS